MKTRLSILVVAVALALGGALAWTQQRAAPEAVREVAASVVSIAVVDAQTGESKPRPVDGVGVVVDP